MILDQPLRETLETLLAGATGNRRSIFPTMITTFPPIAKGVEATTNPLPISDDELIYRHIFLGRLRSFTDDVFNMAFADKASLINMPDVLDHERTKVPVSMAAGEVADLKMVSIVEDVAADRHKPIATRISDDADVAAVEAVLGYTFQSKDLLEAALTHTSFRGRRRKAASMFKKLELMGDKVISLVVTRHHLSESDDSHTLLHSLNVDNEKLARAAVSHGLHRFFRHEVPSFQRHVDDFAEEIAGYPVHSNGQAWTPKLLSDIVESLIGAVYIDSNDTEQVWQVFQRLADPLIGPETMAAIGKQPMTEFTELNHKMRAKAKIDMREWGKSGTVKVVLAGETIGSATHGRSKDVARNRAVKSALDTISLASQHGSAKFPSQVWRKK